MYFYHSQTNNPYFNIATEEYLLKQFNDDFFYIYINEPSIVVGKHQNTMAEINVPYAMENQLKVVRRLSGGGTVFHDKGNINFCFIQKGAPGNLVNFKKYSQPILDTLQNLGVNAYLKGKSDLVIDDLKFSGNAEHVYRNKVLHHGTLLYQSELGKLNEAIKADWNKFTDKAVRSNRSTVTNIRDHLNEKLSLEAFISKLKETVFNQLPDINLFEMTVADKKAIELLVNEKYSTWDWNFAYSPQYQFQKKQNINGKELAVSFQVNKGIIENARICINQIENPELINSIEGLPHHYPKLKEVLSRFFQNKELPIAFNEFMQQLF
ncbi:MAG: lipoate--protein ligase [Salinivirgaceae bacterium]|jgi:lipoate-protein ligase A